MESADKLSDGSIPRTKVAQVCVEALFEPASRNKLVEIVAKSEVTEKSFEELFAGVV
ncbi:MAG: SDR family NAD(P)-dependent oxidoreductase, partial [Microcoleus sp.]